MLKDIGRPWIEEKRTRTHSPWSHLQVGYLASFKLFWTLQRQYAGCENEHNIAKFDSVTIRFGIPKIPWLEIVILDDRYHQLQGADFFLIQIHSIWMWNIEQFNDVLGDTYRSSLLGEFHIRIQR